MTKTNFFSSIGRVNKVNKGGDNLKEKVERKEAEKQKKAVKFKKWYIKNRDKVAEEKKLRYQRDLDYREQVLGRSKERYKLLQEQKALKYLKKLPKLANMPLFERGEMQFYLLADVAKCMGRSTMTFRNWKKLGLNIRFVKPIHQKPIRLYILKEEAEILEQNKQLSIVTKGKKKGNLDNWIFFERVNTELEELRKD